jgi:hypothetical protein
MIYAGTEGGQLYEWDSINSWTLRAPTLGESYINSLVSYNGKLYIFYISGNLIRCVSYDISGNTWNMENYVTMQQKAATSSEIGSNLISSKIYVSIKYDENSIPATIYLYVYDISGNSWTSELVDICGSYNLNINDSMIESDGSYIYIQERSSKLLHKIDLTSKNDTQYIINNETDTNSSIIMMGSYIYTYTPTNNTFEKINITTGQTQNLTAPTFNTCDDITNIENTTLSDDGSYIYLSINKGVQWVTTTYLYKYDISGNSWSQVSVPSAGSISFNGRLCNYSTTIYGVDSSHLYVYDTTSGWKILSDLPRDDADDSIICADSSYVYVLINQCGYFWRYNISADSWQVRQSVSLPAPTAYEGVSPGHMLIDGTDIYLGLYYNMVTTTRDTFYYKYDTTNDVWSTYVAPKTSVNRSFYMYLYKNGSNLMLAGCIQYINGTTDTYRYTIHERTDAANNTWSTNKTADINNIANDKYICMYGQTLVSTKMYINFTTADNLGFNCSGPTCRVIDTSAGTSTYWSPNPIDKMYTVAIDTSYVYYLSLDNNIFYKYDISATTTTIETIPKRSYVNYFICMHGSTKYLLGKQEIEYNPSLYKYKFIIYRDSSGTWVVADTEETTFSDADDMKLNAIQEYYFLTDTVYMAAFLKRSNTYSYAAHKKYKLSTKELLAFDVDTLVTSITSTSSSELGLAKGNSIVLYNINTEATTLFIEGISGNRSTAYLYVYTHNSNIRAIGGQYYTPADGAKFVTYEKVSTTWSGLSEQSIPSTFYNTMDYTSISGSVYMINTTSHTKYNTTTNLLQYVSNAPDNVSICCEAVNNTINLYSDHYECNTYNYDNSHFYVLAGDVEKTHMSSNLLLSSGTLYFIKNNVTNKIGTIDVSTNTQSYITTNKVFENTPFLTEVDDTKYIFIPEDNTLNTLSTTTVTTVASGLNLHDYCSACVKDDKIYYTTGAYYFGFFNIDVTTYNITTLKNLPEQPTKHASLAAYGDYILYITSNKLYRYNINTNSWEKIKTLKQPISSRGIHIGHTYLYYCGTSYINTLTLSNLELESSYYGPIPVAYYGSFVKDGNKMYIYYNESDIMYSCSSTLSEDKVISLDMTTITHQPPTSIPYNLSNTDNTEKAVTITWEVSSTTNITHYRIYRRKTQSDLKEYVGSSTTTSFTDTLADRGETYYYCVRSCNEWGCTSSTSTELRVDVNGAKYTYSFKTEKWNNATKTNSTLEGSFAYRWGNSNIDFNNSVVISVTFGEAYECYITAWDDETHSSTNNVLLQNECYRISSCAFCSANDTNLEEPTNKAMYSYPRYNVVLKGDTSYYGKFNLPYEPIANRLGAYVVFKPILLNVPASTMSKGKYEFVTSFHYKYT